ncbi:MAG TPA: SgcJ/EcaC family oxidoreductase [Thermoanaerobaculia bacterium]
MSEQQIHATFAEFRDAWNAHDVPAMGACWTADGTVIDLWGRFMAGRASVEEYLREEHETTMRESHYRYVALDIRPLSDVAAVIECDGVIENVLAPNGKRYELAHRVDGVMVADADGRWRFATLHPSFKHAG